MPKVRLEFGNRTQEIGGRNTIVQHQVVDHMNHQHTKARKKLQTPGAAPAKFAVYANQGGGINSPTKGLRAAGAQALHINNIPLNKLNGYGPADRRYRDICQHETGFTSERVINKASPTRKGPYGPSPAAAMIRPPTGTGGFAASVQASLQASIGSPEKSLPKITEAAAQPTMAAAQVQQAAAVHGGNRAHTAGFKLNQRGFNTAQMFHQDVTAPAFAAKQRCEGPIAAIGHLADFGSGASPAANTHCSKMVNINGANSNTGSHKHRNTMGGVMPSGGHGYLHTGHRRRVVNNTWNASTESQPHQHACHAKSHHPLSPRRLIRISPRAAQNRDMRGGAMASIMQHDHVH